MTVAILFNPISGAGRAQIVAQTIAHGLSRLGFVTTLMPTQRGPSAQWLRPQLIMVGADAIDILIVVGGDGAVRQAAFEAAHAKIPLWHAPGGTENLFAQSFGMTCDVDAIAHAMREQHTTTIDLASANDEPFVIMASIGLDAEVVHQLASARMGAISHLSYARPIVTQLFEWKPSWLAWTIEGEREELGRGMVVVANMPRYGARIDPAPDAVANDGALDAVFIPAANGCMLLPQLAQMRLGWQRHMKSLRVRRGRSIVLEATPGARLQLDGDPAHTSPANDLQREVVLRVLEQRLIVLHPLLGLRRNPV
ncbi:MAG: hypothetical protein DWI12_09010 [Planctomycetota bacterium]|nr:MAG: hypothetical protein DWI12_09010 [Planctomycetota bacterium]